MTKLWENTSIPGRRLPRGLYAFILRGVQCPECNAPMEHMIAPRPPETGDVTVCCECTTFVKFIAHNIRYVVRTMTEEEIGDLKDDERINMIRVRRAIKEAQMSNPHMTGDEGGEVTRAIGSGEDSNWSLEYDLRGDPEEAEDGSLLQRSHQVPEDADRQPGKSGDRGSGSGT